MEYVKEFPAHYDYGCTPRLSDLERAKIAISTRCLSIDDYFWVNEASEELTWKDVNLFEMV